MGEITKGQMVKKKDYTRTKSLFETETIIFSDVQKKIKFFVEKDKS